jgi:hypothetical protein
LRRPPISRERSSDTSKDQILKHDIGHAAVTCVTLRKNGSVEIGASSPKHRVGHRRRPCEVLLDQSR